MPTKVHLILDVWRYNINLLIIQTRNKGGLFWLLSCMTQLTDGVSHYLNLWWPPSIRLNGITRLEWQYHCLCQSTGLIVGLHPANERQHYFIATSLIGWVQAYNQPWSSLLYLPFSFWGVSYHRYVIWHSHWSPILDRRSARGTNIMHKVREVAKSWWYSEQVPVTALHKLVDRDVTIHFGYNTIRIAIHGLRYSCDTIHFPWPQHWEWDSQWQPGVRRPVIRSTAHSWLVLISLTILKVMSFQACFCVANVKCTVVCMKVLQVIGMYSES